MTPREHAEALGWVRDPGGWWLRRAGPWAGAGNPCIVHATSSSPWRRKPLKPAARWFACPDATVHHTEDEALAHALLLRDVVLS